MKQVNEFKVGDNVEWDSNLTIKRGRVVAIVPAGEFVYRFKLKRMAEGYEQFEKYSKRFLSDGMSRKHDSYLILVGEKWLYWPRVSQLRKLYSLIAESGKDGIEL